MPRPRGSAGHGKGQGYGRAGRSYHPQKKFGLDVELLYEALSDSQSTNNFLLFSKGAISVYDLKRNLAHTLKANEDKIIVGVEG